jgi:hypothetical protein
MTKKNILLIILVLVFGGFSLYWNRGRFQKPPLQVSHRSMQPRAGMARVPVSRLPANPVVFLLNRIVRLKSVEVIPVSDIETNKYPHPVWKLIADSASAPVQDFLYGAPVDGMKPSVKGAAADPLAPGVNYRVIVLAGSEKAEHDFIPVAREP